MTVIYSKMRFRCRYDSILFAGFSCDDLTLKLNETAPFGRWYDGGTLPLQPVKYNRLDIW
jgi:hypothetical protein